MPLSRSPQRPRGSGARTTTTHLADTGVADEEELEEVVVFARVHRARRGLEAGEGSWGGLAGGRGGRR